VQGKLEDQQQQIGDVQGKLEDQQQQIGDVQGKLEDQQQQIGDVQLKLEEQQQQIETGQEIAEMLDQRQNDLEAEQERNARQHEELAKRVVELEQERGDESSRASTRDTSRSPRGRARRPLRLERADPDREKTVLNAWRATMEPGLPLTLRATVYQCVNESGRGMPLPYAAGDYYWHGTLPNHVPTVLATGELEPREDRPSATGPAVWFTSQARRADQFTSLSQNARKKQDSCYMFLVCPLELPQRFAGMAATDRVTFNAARVTHVVEYAPFFLGHWEPVSCWADSLDDD